MAVKHFLGNHPSTLNHPHNPSTHKKRRGTCFSEVSGYLYGAKLAGDGHIFYCPAVLPTPFYEDGTPAPYSAERYSPLLTTDGGGAVRSSYHFNPRMINWNPNIGNVNTHRRYPKTAQFEPHKVFALDLLSGVYAHSADQGYNVAFTDGSVKFCKVTSPLAALLAYNVLINDRVVLG
jgi:hypothetical protein